MPIGVLGFTSTVPVAGVNTSCGGTVEPEAKTTVELAGVAGAPLIVSEVNALSAAGAPFAPLNPEPVSDVATTGAGSTITVTVELAQLVGFSCSQIL